MIPQLPRKSFALSDVGGRESNEDAFVIDESLGLFVVADGVGGQANGEVASAQSVMHVHEFVGANVAALEGYLTAPAERHEEALAALCRLMESAVQNACYLVYGLAEQEPQSWGMSTTLSALLLVGDRAIVGQVGDSRIYRLRGGELTQLTEDHTLAQYRLKFGLARAGEHDPLAETTITRAVGHLDYVEVDTFHYDVQPGDRYLLCSDGLYGCLESREIAALLGEPRIDQATIQVVELAKNYGSSDNITAIIVAIG